MDENPLNRGLALSSRWKEWSLALRRNAVLNASLVVAVRRHERAAAVNIQRVARGRFGRLRFKRLRVVHWRESLQARYNSANGVYKFYFEQNGAAIRIQNW